MARHHHQARLPRRPLEFIVTEGLAGALHAVPLDDLDDARIRCLLPRGRLIASCDGLLLLEVRGQVNIERLLVCNPVTRQWTAVPLPRSDTGMRLLPPQAVRRAPAPVPN